MVILVCDMCAAEGREDVRAETVMVGGFEVEGCETHRQELQTMADVLTKFGRPAKKVQRTGPGRPQSGSNGTTGIRRVRCGSCGQEVAYSTKSYHAQQHHGVKGSELEWTEL
jgi:hypothetical protein